MGFAEQMINRLKENRLLLRTPGERMRKIRQVYLDAGIINYESNKPVHRILTEEERQKIRKKIIRQYKKERWKKALALLIALILTSAFLYLLFFKVHLLYPYFEQ